MTPQLRPFQDITTEDIFRTATHWMCVRKEAPEVIEVARFSLCAIRLFVAPDVMVYPFTYTPDTGVITPTLWPVLEEEEEILEWKGVDSCSKYWTAGDEANAYWQPYAYGPDHPSLLARPGFSPEKRLKHRWVWEKNTEKKGTS